MKKPNICTVPPEVGDYLFKLERERDELKADYRALHKQLTVRDREIARLTARDKLITEISRRRKEEVTALRAKQANLVAAAEAALDGRLRWGFTLREAINNCIG